MSAQSSVQRSFGAFLVALSVLFGGAFAFAQTKTPAPAASVSASAKPSAAPAPASASATPSYTTGFSPVGAGSATPKKWLPPGADWPDVGPSNAIFPTQKISVRFNHKVHVVGQKLNCGYCHTNAEKSTLASDNLMPKKHDACVDCHSIDEKEPLKDDSPPARCDACHIGGKVDANGAFQVAKAQFPPSNMKMNHKAHIAKGMKCAECHGEVGELELATRDQLPRMKGCFSCHQSGDSGGIAKKTAGAKSECTTCHTQEKDGTLKTMFASGTLVPPKWLKNSHHGSDWIERHKKVAGADSGFCGSCHTEKYCVDCHDGKTKPRSVHPNDWLNMHEIAARFDGPKCTSCHSTTNFCLPCHTRVGVAQSSPSGVQSAVRFHPDAAVWSAPKRVPGHHSFEAQKNINACVSCHVERDCVVCHGTQGVGGANANPHGPSFANKCATMFAKNPRPCFVCHEPGDKWVNQCK
ncbi:MAG: cytochrome c3 family protein [Polyangiales bacterium]